MPDTLLQMSNTQPEPADGILLILDAGFKVTHINKAGAESLGYSVSEIIGKNWFDDFLPTEEGRRLKDLFSRLIATNPKRLERFEHAVQTSSGELSLVRWYNSLIRDKEGKIAGSMSWGTNVHPPAGGVNQPVREAVEKRKLVLSAFLNAQEKERRQVAENLHENISQVLTTCKLLLEGEQQRTTSPTLEKANDYLQQVINQLRAITHWLNPKQLAEIGLDSATKELIKQIAPNSHPKVEFKVNNTRALRKLAPDIQLSLFRIIQEQLNNIIQHAAATHAQVRIFLTSNWVELEISDNGKGFIPKTLPATCGLYIIRSRAENHGGAMHLESAPGKGCLISVCLPLDTL